MTADGVPIEAEHRAADGGSTRLAIVVAHGFTGALGRPGIRRAAAAFAGHGGVITFSFRGHGGSGGHSTVGDREVLDLDAAVRWARALGYGAVATVGFSMGGAVVLRHAGGGWAWTPAGGRGPAQRLDAREAARAPGGARGASGGFAAGVSEGPGGFAAGRAERPGGFAAGGAEAASRPQAAVAVSSPARWYYRGTAPMRRLHWVVTRPAGRLVSRLGLRTRVHSREWDPVPRSPVESVPHIAPTPLLIVHGDRDPYFPLDHPHALAAAAGDDAAELWIERGFGHAENAAAPALLGRIGDWLTSHVPAE